MTPPLDEDPRWRRLKDEGRVCGSCGVSHKGLFDLASFRPEHWAGEERYEPNGALRLDGDFLSEDFCVIGGESFFVRGVLELPIIGSGGETFGYGVWSTLSRENFGRYVDGFDAGHRGDEDWFGWFSNRLKGWPDTLHLKCRVRARPGRQRPRFLLEPTDHPLALAQGAGVNFDRLLDIYAATGHDIRPLLSA
jgi:hypothetical protein